MQDAKQADYWKLFWRYKIMLPHREETAWDRSEPETGATGFQSIRTRQARATGAHKLSLSVYPIGVTDLTNHPPDSITCQAEQAGVQRFSFGTL